MSRRCSVRWWWNYAAEYVKCDETLLSIEMLQKLFKHKWEGIVMRFAERPRNSLSYIFPFLHFFSLLLLYFALSALVTGNISCCLPWSFVAKTSLKFISLRVTSWIDGGKSERAPSKLNVINSVEEEKEEKGKKNLNRMNGWWRKNVKITYCITGWKPLAQWLNPSFVSFYSKQDVLSSVLKWETFPLNISHFKWMHTFFSSGEGETR